MANSITWEGKSPLDLSGFMGNYNQAIQNQNTTMNALFNLPANFVKLAQERNQANAQRILDTYSAAQLTNPDMVNDALANAMPANSFAGVDRAVIDHYVNNTRPTELRTQERDKFNTIQEGITTSDMTLKNFANQRTNLSETEKFDADTIAKERAYLQDAIDNADSEASRRIAIANYDNWSRRIASSDYPLATLQSAKVSGLGLDKTVTGLSADITKNNDLVFNSEKDKFMQVYMSLSGNPAAQQAYLQSLDPLMAASVKEAGKNALIDRQGKVANIGLVDARTAESEANTTNTLLMTPGQVTGQDLKNGLDAAKLVNPDVYVNGGNGSGGSAAKTFSAKDSESKYGINIYGDDGKFSQANGVTALVNFTNKLNANKGIQPDLIKDGRPITFDAWKAGSGSKELAGLSPEKITTMYQSLDNINYGLEKVKGRYKNDEPIQLTDSEKIMVAREFARDPSQNRFSGVVTQTGLGSGIRQKIGDMVRSSVEDTNANIRQFVRNKRAELANGSDSAIRQQLTNEVTALKGKGLDLDNIDVAVELTNKGITDMLDPGYRNTIRTTLKKHNRLGGEKTASAKTIVLSDVNTNPAAALLKGIQPSAATPAKPAPKVGTVPTQALTAGAIAGQQKMANAQYAKILAENQKKEKAKAEKARKAKEYNAKQAARDAEAFKLPNGQKATVPAVLKKKEPNKSNGYFSQFSINK